MREKFQKLTSLLLKYQHLWKDSAFKDRDHTRFDAYPALKKWLFSLPEAQLLQYQENNQILLTSISPFFKDAATLLELIDFPISKQLSSRHQPKCWDNDIPGRKAKQILAFSQAIGEVNQSILEWCCGKQHLGRYLSEVHQHISDGLEIDTNLVLQGRQLAFKRKLEQQVNTHTCDVLSKQCDQFLQKDQHAIALHACGGLHVRLVEKATQHQIKRITFSPCCYHRFNHVDHYQPLSKMAKDYPLLLNMDDLRLAVRETKTASINETNKRRQLQAWRLGFDELQREHSRINNYLETPSLSPTILQADFKYFCLHLARLKNLKLKQLIDFDHYEARGLERLHYYERTELFRMAFRRPLEAWLVLDKALYFEENGYKTTVSIFCSPDITPRNFFIDAYRIA